MCLIDIEDIAGELPEFVTLQVADIKGLSLGGYRLAAAAVRRFLQS
jgi:hypothetical protein